MLNKYVGILVWCAFTVLLMKSREIMYLETVNSERVWRMKKWAAVLVFLPVVIMATTRGWFGDTFSYYRTFRNGPNTYAELLDYLTTLKKDVGFYGATALLRCIVGDHYKIYFFILALIQSSLLIRTYRKFSTNYALSFFLFITSADYISWMFNGVRQFTAVTIVFAAFEWILNKKYIRATIVIVIASTFHGTALLMLPFMFICQGKAWNKKSVLFILAVLLSVTFLDTFTNILDGVLYGTQYENVVYDFTVGEFKNDDGTNPLRVLVYCIPALLSFWGRKKIWESNNSVINLCANMSVITAGFYLISMETSGILLGRLPIYFSLYSYILLPWEIEHLFAKRNKQILYAALICCYLLYYFYQMHFQNGLI